MILRAALTDAVGGDWRTAQLFSFSGELVISRTMRLLVGLLMLSTALGCTASMKRSFAPQLDAREANARVDAAASEVELACSWRRDPKDAEKLREEVAGALQQRLSYGNGPTTPARFRLTGTQLRQIEVLCVMGLWLFFGCPAYHDAVNINLELQIGDRVYSARGEGTSSMSLYHQDSDREALGKALTVAFEDVARQISSSSQR